MNSDRRSGKQYLLIISLYLVFLFSPFIPFAGAQSSTDGQKNQYPNTQFSPSMAIIIVVLIAALFFMGFFSIYIRHCSDTSGSGSIRGVAGAIAGLSRRGPRGLDREVIDKFPTLVYSTVKGLKIGKGALECAVCLNEFEDEETLRLIPKCDHVFHPECIDAWLESHTTCPVCRANLVPEVDESTHVPHELTAVSDIEAQNEAVEEVVEGRNVDEQQLQSHLPEPDVLDRNKTLNRNRTRRSRSSRIRRLFPRSHSTGHSLVQPGENTERFTLRLPVEVRKQVINRQLNRASSMVVLPREGSSRRGYRTSGGEGSSRGRNSRLFERSDHATKSDRWAFTMIPPFLTRMSSVNSPKVAANDGVKSQGTSSQTFAPGVEQSDSVRPPV